jgi:hypothetical protein
VAANRIRGVPRLFGMDRQSTTRRRIPCKSLLLTLLLPHCTKLTLTTRLL